MNCVRQGVSEYLEGEEEGGREGAGEERMEGMKRMKERWPSVVPLDRLISLLTGYSPQSIPRRKCDRLGRSSSTVGTVQHGEG